MAQRKPIRVVVFGAGGRMGAALVPALDAASQFEVTGALVRPGDARTGRGVLAMPVLSYRSRWPDEGADVAIDFTRADGFDSVLAECVKRRCPLVSGTTGLSGGQQGTIDDAARKIPVLWSSNFSLGMALLRKLVSIAASALPDHDCEIVEIHHRGKRDAPSGTALSLGETVAEARRVALADMMETGGSKVEGDGRNSAAIGLHSLRLGESIGEHNVLFASPVERIELTHRALDRTVFAQGALRAAQWLTRQAPGSYRIDDLLGIL